MYIYSHIWVLDCLKQAAAGADWVLKMHVDGTELELLQGESRTWMVDHSDI